MQVPVPGTIIFSTARFRCALHILTPFLHQLLPVSPSLSLIEHTRERFDPLLHFASIGMEKQTILLAESGELVGYCGVERFGLLKIYEREYKVVRLRAADSLDGIAKYLTRNPALSFVSQHLGKLIGKVSLSRLFMSWLNPRNESAQQFHNKRGWIKREEIEIFLFVNGVDSKA